MLIREIQREDLDIHYFKLLNGLSPSLDINLTDWYEEKINRDYFDNLWSDFTSNSNYHILVAVSQPYTLGTASLLVEQKINGKFAGHIEDVVVSTSHRGLGIGSLLIKDLIEIAKNKKCYKVILNCSDKNIAFYRQFGFLKIDNGMKLTL